MAEALLGRSKISKDDLIILNLILSLSASDLPSRNINKYSRILVLVLRILNHSQQIEMFNFDIENFLIIMCSCLFCLSKLTATETDVSKTIF